MARWEPWAVIDGAYSDDAKPWACQDTVNWLPTPAEQAGARSAIMLQTPPGLVEYCDLGTNAPVRGSHDVEGLLLVVSGTTLFKVIDGTATSLGTIPGVGRVSMDHIPRGSGFQVGIANGSSGYVYDTADNSLVQITDEGFPGAVIFQFIDNYLAFLEPFGRFWGHSELNDALSYNTLDRYTAESAPDPIRSLIVSHREVFVPGTRSGEFFRNTGAATGTFARSDGTEMERGVASAFAIGRLDNTIFWLGENGVVYEMQGHQPVRVSTGPIEQAIARSNPANAFAFTWEDKGHNVFYLTLPDGQTWGFDAWTRRWHRRQSYGLNRWRLNTLTRTRGAWIGGDYRNGKLYTLSWAEDAVHEGGEPLVSERTFPIAHDNFNDLIINGLRLLVDTGRKGPGRVGLTGHLPDGYVGQSGTYQYLASGGIGPYAISKETGVFPDGATMNGSGLVTYTYTEAGVFARQLRAVDTVGMLSPLHDDTTTVLALPWFTSSTTGVVKSIDGVDWLAAPGVDAGISIFSGGGKVVNVRFPAGLAVGETSSDLGDTWVPHTGLSAESCHQGAYTGTHYLICANNRTINRSTDAVAWTPFLIGSGVLSTNLVAIDANGATVLVGGSEEGNGHNIAVSTDHGATFPVGVMCFGAGITRDVYAIAHSGARFIAVGNQNRMAYTDTNGGSWTQIVSPFPGTDTVRSIASNGAGVWVAVNTVGQIGYSANNGVTWSLSADTVTADPACTVGYGAGRFIIGSATEMKVSFDGGATWSLLPDNQTGLITGITPVRF